MLTHFSLCSGIGGLDLAAEWAGFETVGQCEIDKYASRVLAKNFKGVKNYGDIRTITAERLAGDGVGAPHRRERVFIICRDLRDANRVGRQKNIVFKQGVSKALHKTRLNAESCGTSGVHGAIPYPASNVMGMFGSTSETEATGARRSNYGNGAQGYASREWWQAEPGLGRVANGVPDWVDRLRCLGNAVVPYQAYPIFAAIAEMENGGIA